MRAYSITQGDVIIPAGYLYVYLQMGARRRRNPVNTDPSDRRRP